MLACLLEEAHFSGKSDDNPVLGCVSSADRHFQEYVYQNQQRLRQEFIESEYTDFIDFCLTDYKK